MVRGLCEAGMPGNNEHLIKAMEWVKSRQQFDLKGDYRVYRPKITPGGWSFEYYNTFYPDVDDTAAVILALLKQNLDSAETTCVIQATERILGIQNSDGGFAAFDYRNNSLF